MRSAVPALILGLALLTAPASGGLLNPWASSVLSYEPGAGGTPGYTNATAALGPAATFTGTGPWDGPVTLFNPPYAAGDVVALGAGGSIVLGFDADLPDRPGADFIVYGNAGFIDADWPNGRIGSSPSLFGEDGGSVEVSPDGALWAPLPGLADGLFPTQPWRDTASTVPADFGRPVAGDRTLSDFSGLSFDEALALYDGSAGGAAFDIAATGWAQIRYIRVSYAGGAAADVEIDAVRAVPEPASLALLLAGGLLAARASGRTRRRP